MSMKKLLLTLIAIVGCIPAMAQAAGEGTSWKSSLQPVSSMDAVNLSSPIARTAEGIVYATGSFDQTLVFGDSFLEPIATSAYLAKYNADGTPAWAVSLAGAATIKTITVAESGEVFIAGQLADQVIFGSTDEVTQTLEGRKAADDTYEKSQSTAFIAKYSAEGVLLATKTFLPADLPSLVATGMFYPVDGDTFFGISSLRVEGTQLYAAATTTGKTEVDGQIFEATGMDVWGFMYSPLSTASIFTMNTTDLTVTGKLMEAKSTLAMTSSTGDNAKNVVFDVENGVVYAAYLATGRTTLTTAAGSTNFEAVGADDWGEIQTTSVVLLTINGNDVKTKEIAQPAIEQTYKSVLGDLQISGENLYIGGSFGEACPLQPELKSVNKTDLYVATVDKELNVKSAAASKLDEQLDNKNEEIFGSMGVIGGVPTLNGYIDEMSSHTVLSTQSYYLGADGLTANELTDHVIGMVGNSKAMTYQTVTTEASFAPVWSKEIDGVAEAGDVNRTAPVAITADGSIYTTGAFSKDVAFGESFLSPIATSAYLAKYNADGTPAWAVSLAGAATIKTITVAESGEVFIAGQLADQVIFGSTDEVTQTLEGRKAADDTYEKSQSTAFIAKYSAEGVLLATKTFLPADLPSLVATGMFYPVDGDTFFGISSLRVEGTQLYAAATTTGKTEVDGQIFEATGMDVWGFMYSPLSTASIFTMNTTDLTVTGKLMEAKSTLAMTSSTGDNAKNVVFDVENGVVYAAYLATGRTTLTTAAGSTNFEAVGADDWGEIQTTSVVLLTINGNDVKTKEIAQPAIEQTYKSVLGDLQISGENLYIGGSFGEACPLQPELKSVNKTDLYVATVDKELNVKSAAASKLDEQLDNKNEEIFTAMAATENGVNLYGYVDEMNGHAILSNLAYTLNNGELTAAEAANLTTGAAAGADKLATKAADTTGKAITTLNGEVLNATIHVISYNYDFEVGVEETAAELVAPVVVFNGSTLTVSEPAQIAVYGMTGRQVLSANGTSANVSALPAGTYVARVKTAAGTTTLKFALNK